MVGTKQSNRRSNTDNDGDNTVQPAHRSINRLYIIILVLFGILGYFTMFQGFIKSMNDILHLGWGLFFIGIILLCLSKMEEKQNV